MAAGALSVMGASVAGCIAPHGVCHYSDNRLLWTVCTNMWMGMELRWLSLAHVKLCWLAGVHNDLLQSSFEVVDLLFTPK